MSFQDVAFLRSSARVSLHFLNIVVEVKASGPPHVLKLWLEVSKTCKIFLLQQSLFLCPSNVMEIIKLLERSGKFGPPQF